MSNNKVNNENLRILFFTESLILGGKERRILELIGYLKQHTNYEITLVLAEPVIHYDYVYDLGITIKIIQRKIFKKDPIYFFKFYRYCRSFKPDIIHSWDIMTTFYSIPAKMVLKIPLISSMITNAQKNYNLFSPNYFFFKTNVLTSDIILSNSKAGLKAYNLTTHKAKVIYNGVDLERFKPSINLKQVRDFFGIKTEFSIVMAAAFSDYKDYNLFLDVAREVYKIRNDVTFIGVGDGPNFEYIKQKIHNERIINVILTGMQSDVERIIAVSDIGILCTYSEGISNSIIEYMALGKPVISTDITGGSQEIVIEGETGYCVERNTKKIVNLIDFLLNNKNTRDAMGEKGKERIRTHFSINRMGKEFEIVYNEVLSKNN